MSARILIIAAAVLLSGAVSLPTAAQTPAPETTAPDTAAGPSHKLTGPAVVFNMLDRNGDGAIDIAEATTLFQSIFTTLDSDDDGKLSKDEINAALQLMRGVGPGFGRAPGRGAPDFRHGMGDEHSGMYDGGHGREYRGQTMPGRQGAGGAEWPGAGQGRPDTSQAAQMPARLPGFGTIDTNGDGFISQQEYNAAGAQ